MIPARVAFQQEPGPPEGLRQRKKARTRLAIQDAALDLFLAKGFDATTVDEIAARAEVSTTTFFAYFRTKAEVIIGDHGSRLPALRQAILERPAAENDLDAIKHAVQEQWVAALDPPRTVRQAEAIKTSHILRGLTFDIGLEWLAVIAEALAQRHGLDAADPTCTLTARVAVFVIDHALEEWMVSGCQGDFATAVDESYRLMAQLGARWFR